MDKQKIKKILTNSIQLDEIYIYENNNHFQIIAISNQFANLNSIKKQQIVYNPLMQYIINKEIHAISIQTYTPEEWKNIIN